MAVVRIKRPDGTFRGTGFFVSPTRVVTCAHVADRPQMQLWAEDGTDLGVADRVDWGWANGSRERADDWAILEVATPVHTVPPMIAAGTAPKATDTWRARGFSLEAPDTGSITLGGKMMEVDAPLYQLSCAQAMHVDFEPAGASGSPVVVRERVVAVFVSGLEREEGGTRGATVYAVPLHRVPYTTRHEDVRLKAMRRWIEGELKPHQALIDALYIDQRDAGKVADALLGEPADRLLPRLRRATKSLLRPDQRAALDALKRVSLRLVPATIDWHFRVRREADVQHLDLRVCTDTLAELILAGVDGREVCFAQGPGEMRRGVSGLSAASLLQRVPMEPDSGEDRRQRELVNCTVDHLAGEFGYARFTKDRQLRLIEHKLETLLQNAGPGEPPPYYLVFDAPDDLWDARHGLADRLPSLRSVCLSGDDATLTDEQDIAMIVHAVLFAEPRSIG